MIFIALNALFNGFILELCFAFINIFLHIKAITNFEFFLIGYSISALSAILCYSKFIVRLVMSLKNLRKPIISEQNIIHPILELVILRINRQYDVDYQASDFNIRIIDKNLTNSFSLGHNNIILSSTMLNYFSDEQLQAVLAHEISHFYYGDNLLLTSLKFGFIIKYLFFWCYSIIAIAKLFTYQEFRAFNMSKNLISCALIFSSIIILLPLFIFSWLGFKILYLISFCLSKQFIYKADIFVCSLGYKAYLIEVLEILKNTNPSNTNFTKRISRLEGYADKNNVVQKRSVKYNYIRELIILFIYLMFIMLSLIIYQKYI